MPTVMKQGNINRGNNPGAKILSLQSRLMHIK